MESVLCYESILHLPNVHKAHDEGSLKCKIFNRRADLAGEYYGSIYNYITRTRILKEILSIFEVLL
jgi:hypothetical protein